MTSFLNVKNKYRPDATNVAECISADAGSGASIESGNQIWNKNWADLMKQATNKKTKKMLLCLVLNKNKLIALLFEWKWFKKKSEKENEFTLL